MYSTECILIATGYDTDGIGVQKPYTNDTLVPIMKIEDIYANEYYQANTLGYKPTLRIRLSVLNYNGENELGYMGKKYTIIRTQNPVPDEIVLVCERQIDDVHIDPPDPEPV